MEDTQMAKPEKLVAPGPGYGKPMGPVRECMRGAEELILGLVGEVYGPYRMTDARVEETDRVNVVTLVFNGPSGEADIEVEVRVLGGRRV